MTYRILLAAALMTVVAAPAFAGHEGDTPKQQEAVARADYWFGKIDANGDGQITQKEHERFSADSYYRADMNDDGIITKDEFMRSAWAEKANANAAVGNKLDKRSTKFWGGKDEFNANK